MQKLPPGKYVDRHPRGAECELEQLGRLIGWEGEDRPAQLPVAENRGVADRSTPAGDRALHRPGPDGDVLALVERSLVGKVVKLVQGLDDHVSPRPSTAFPLLSPCCSRREGPF